MVCMQEMSPRITYSPDGELTLRKRLDDDAIIADALVRKKEDLSTKKGYEVTEDDSDTVISVDVSRVLRCPKELSFTNETAERLVENLSPFTYLDFRNTLDGVFSLDFWGRMGANGIVYPQFQRWLNAGGPDEATARLA